MLVCENSLAYPNSISAKLMGTKPGKRSQGNQNRSSRKSKQLSQLSSLAHVQLDKVRQTTNSPTVKSDVILIVDDTPSNLQVLFSYLEQEGFKVLLAEDGESALQIAQSQAPDLILLDILMPELDGFETCRLLKAQASTRDIPIIFLTALSETVNKVQGFKLGGVDYITKPIAQEEVLVRIQTHLTLQKMGRTLANQNQELKQALDFEALVNRLTNKIRDSLDENIILTTATKELVELLNLNSCQIEFYDSEQITTTIAYEYTTTLPSVQGSIRQIAEFVELYQQLLQKIPVQLVETIPQFDPKGIQVNRLACPIFDNRGIIGNLWVFRPPGEVFTNFEIQLIQQVASQCAIAIRQARLYQAANQQIEELGKLNQLKDDFLKTITHELKAPMSSIQLATQTMEKLLMAKGNPQRSATFNKVLQIFRDSCQRQNQLIDDLLTLCYVNAKAKTIVTESIALDLWISEITQLFLGRTQTQQQQLVLDLATQKLEIVTDPLILERIFQELLNNACKYTPANETITIQTKATETEIYLCIINSGVEIPQPEQELIFTQFYRIPNQDPWQYGGTGLGLTLVSKLVEMLGASIELESKNNQTTFCVRFFKEQ